MGFLRLLFLVTLFSLFQARIYAYSIDSLKRQIATLPEDTNLLKLLNKLAGSYQNERVFDTSDIYANMAMTLAIKLQSQMEEAESLYILGLINIV